MNNTTNFKQTQPHLRQGYGGQVGQIPEDWKNDNLAKYLSFSNGKSSPERFESAPYPVYGANGIIGHAEETNSPANTIVIGRVGSYCGNVQFSNQKLWATDNTITANTKYDNIAKYFYYLLKNLKLNKKATGSGQPLLTQTILKSIPVNVAPSKKQQEIADILYSLDQKIELNRKMNETLEEIGKAIFKHWFIDFEFPWNFEKNEFDLEGEPYKSGGGEMKKTVLGAIPESWKVKEIGDVATTQYGYTQSASEEKVGPHFLRVTDINKSDWIQWSAVPFCEIEPADLKKYNLKRGDIVIARMADPGKVAIIDNDTKNAVFASYLIRLELKEQDILTPYYLFYYLNSPFFQEFVSGASTGTTRKSINATEIRNFDLLIPSPKAVKYFTKTVNRLRNNIIKNVKESESLTKIRDLLLPRLMSGRIRI